MFLSRHHSLCSIAICQHATRRDATHTTRSSLHACPPKASIHSPWSCQKSGTSARMRQWHCQLVGGPFTTFLVRGFSLCSSSKPNGTSPLILSGNSSSSPRRLLFIDTAYARPSLCWAPPSTTPGMLVVVGRILAHRRLQTSGGGRWFFRGAKLGINLL